MGHIIHFKLTSADPAATADFYSRAFGWESTPSPFIPNYFTAATGEGPGIDGAIMDSSYQRQSVIAWIEVADINAAVEAVIAAGGSEAGDISQITGVGHVGCVADPNGVLIGLRQSVQSAPGRPSRAATR
jgi:predicted enzyme related to lactoylglutathione lyase